MHILNFLKSKIFTIIFLSSFSFLAYLTFSQHQPDLWLSFSYIPLDTNKSLRTTDGLIPPLWIDQPLNNFSSTVVLFLCENYLVVTLFGYSLLRSFFGFFSIGTFLASFFVGYTCLLGIIRIYSFFLPYNMVYWPVLITELLVILLFKNPNSYSQLFRTLKNSLNKQLIFKNFLWVILLLGFLATVLALQIRQYNFAFVGHGTLQYAYLLENWQAQTPHHFPLFNKHYDELIFHYFLLSPFTITFDPLLSWWITLGLIKTSMLAFLYFFFRKLGVGLFPSLIFTLFMFLGTSSLIPTKYYMLFDSANFLFFTAHSGRIVGIGLMLLLLVDILKEKTAKDRLSLLTILLIGVGLSATSISNSLWILAFYTWAFIMVLYFRNTSLELQAPEDVSRNKSQSFLCYTSLATTLLLYALPFDKPIFYNFRSWAICLVTILILRQIMYKFQFICFNIKNFWTLENKAFIRSFILVGSIFFGLIFLGNAFVENPARKAFTSYIGKFVKETKVQLLPMFKGRPIDGEQKGSFALGDYRETGAWNEHCKGVSKFVAYYGVLLTLILFTHFLFKRKADERTPLPWQDYVIYELFLLATACLPVFLFFMDFVDFGSRAWLKSRFLEGPVYIILATSLYFIYRFCSHFQKIFIIIVLIVYMLVPFIATKRVDQLVNNAKVFTDVLKSGN